jgi:hypothetical protein
MSSGVVPYYYCAVILFREFERVLRVPRRNCFLPFRHILVLLLLNPVATNTLNDPSSLCSRPGQPEEIKFWINGLLLIPILSIHINQAGTSFEVSLLPAGSKHISFVRVTYICGRICMSVDPVSTSHMTIMTTVLWLQQGAVCKTPLIREINTTRKTLVLWYTRT